MGASYANKPPPVGVTKAVNPPRAGPKEVPAELAAVSITRGRRSLLLLALSAPMRAVAGRNRPLPMAAATAAVVAGAAWLCARLLPTAARGCCTAHATTRTGCPLPAGRFDSTAPRFTL